MFKWLRSRRCSDETDPAVAARDDDRDSGEDEYESYEEEAREVAPSDLTRVKTDDL